MVRCCRELFEFAPEGYLVTNAEGIIAEANRTAAELVGRQRGFLAGKPLDGFLAPEHRANFRHHLERLRAGRSERVGEWEVRLQRRDGTLRDVELTAAVVRGPKRKRLAGIRWLIRDLTAARRAAAALADASARTQAIVEAAVDGIVTIDERGIIESFNPAAERLFGYTAGEAIGQRVNVLMPPPHSDAHSDYIAHYLQTGEKKVIGIGREVVGRRKDGSTFPMELAVSEVHQSGHVLFIGIARDISQRKEAEQTLWSLRRQAQQRERLADIGAITAQIVHEVGNPLAGISTQAQLILRRAERDDSQPLTTAVPAVERILSEVHRLDGLVKEFMEFSRDQRLQLKQIDVRRLLREVIDFWEPVAAGHEVALSVEVPNEVPPLTADAEKLRRVFDNLVKNAIEAIDHGPGRVVAEVTLPSPEAVHIAVSDTGPGIADAVQVFRLFETTKPHGSGIGLAVARQIVLAHRGTIDYSRLQPRGTAFHIELPRGGPLA